MKTRDLYDPCVAFDDVVVLGGDVHSAFEHAVENAAEAKRRLKRHIRHRRLRPPVKVQTLGFDVTQWSFILPGSFEIIGSEEIVGLGMFEALLKKFQASMPRPRAVRVDGEESYKTFREGRRAKYIAELERRLALLERQVADHVADNHANGRLQRLEDELHAHLAESVHGDDVIDSLIGCATVGGARVGLELPRRARKAAAAWQDGPEVLVTICLVGPDGQKKYATSGAPLADHVEHVVEAAEAEGVEPELLHAVGPETAQEAAAESVLVGLAQAAPALVCCGDAFVGALDFGRPEMAAAMSLIQHCQRGNKRACAELAALWQSGHSKMLRTAGKVLQQAQKR